MLSGVAALLILPVVGWATASQVYKFLDRNHAVRLVILVLSVVSVIVMLPKISWAYAGWVWIFFQLPLFTP